MGGSRAGEQGGFVHVRRVFITWCVAVVVYAAALAAAAVAQAGLTSAESSLLVTINKVRTAHRLSTLRVDPRLERAARAHSFDMLHRGYFDHGAFGTRMASFRVRGTVMGENLAWGTGPLGSAAVVVREWLASPGHRENVLLPGFRRIGIAAPVGPFAGFPRARVVTADFAGG
jgi:uncharacterized protein YkwD